MIPSKTIKLSVAVLCAVISLPQIGYARTQSGYEDRENYRHQVQSRATQNQRPNRYRNDNSYERGGHVTAQYRRNYYYVDDWQNRRLRQPPRGYRWLRNDRNQFMMIAITSGIISEIVNQNDYPQGERWYVGERVNARYLSEGNRVEQWRRRGLPRPSRGHYWINFNRQYLLIDASSRTIVRVYTFR